MYTIRRFQVIEEVKYNLRKVDYWSIFQNLCSYNALNKKVSTLENLLSYVLLRIEMHIIHIIFFQYLCFQLRCISNNVCLRCFPPTPNILFLMNGSISMWCSIKYLSVLWGQELDYTGHLTYVEGEAVQQRTKWCLLRYNDYFTTEILIQKNPHLFLHILDFKCQLDMSDTGIYLSFHLPIHPSLPPSFLPLFFLLGFCLQRKTCIHY